MKLIKLAVFLAIATISMPIFARQAQKPQLIVAISVDQFSSELFTQYRPAFTGGLKRLSEGAVFAHGYQAHSMTETCPGHSTILTGDYPAHTGIIANNWMKLDLPREDKAIYCAEDERVPGSSTAHYTVSPYHLKVPTLGDRMKLADPKTRVVAVAGKDRSAVMMGGHNPDQRWWWSRNRFVTHPEAKVSPGAALINANVAEFVSKARPSMPVSGLCAPKDKAVAVTSDKTVGAHRFQREAGDASAFTRSPELDGATLAMATALTREMRLGKDRHIDLLAIGLSATDYIGHRYGTQGLEMCLQIEVLDAALGKFFAMLDHAGIDYAVVLTADHGGLDLPERQGGSAQRVDPALDSKALSREIGQRLGISDETLHGDGSFGDIYIDRSDPARHAAIENEAVKILTANPQVARVQSFDELAAMPMPTGPPQDWTLAERARASFDPETSGDLVVQLKPFVTPIAKPTESVATHGSPWDYDRQVPILFWRKGMKATDKADPAMTVDIMPTLAAMISLPVPSNEIDGHCLALPGLDCPKR
jgi:predicted AlkP superfamily pyrophosphatase or phosphodiesterase